MTLQYARPRLKSGQIFGSMVSTDQETSILYELSDGSRQVSLPALSRHVLPLLDGTRTIPDIFETLRQTVGPFSFKSLFRILRKLQLQGCLDGAEVLATRSARNVYTEVFEREPAWPTRPIVSHPLVAGKILGDPSVLAFVLFAVGTLVVTISFIAGGLGLGFVRVPSDFLRIQDSYVKGLLFFFLAASVLITTKTMLKAILSLLLTGARSRFDLEWSLLWIAVRTQDEKIYRAGGRVLGTLAFAAVALSSFFIFAVASAVAPHWSLLDDLFWTSMILAIFDLTPWRRSDLSSFFNATMNTKSQDELLFYIRNQALSGLTSAIYAALTLAWTCAALAILAALAQSGSDLLLATIRTTANEGPVAEFIAASILAFAFAATLATLTLSLVMMIAQNILASSKSRRLLKRSRRQTREAKLENVEMLARTIGQIPLFSGLHGDAILFLISKGHARDVSKGAPILVQGTPCREFHILLSGQVRIEKHRESGASEELARLQAPATFGENTLLSASAHTADVFAQRESRILTIPRRAIDELLNHSVLKTEAEPLLDRLILGQYADGHHLFQKTPREVLSLFFNEGEIISIATGRHIIEQGRTDKDIYLLIRGSVDVIHNGQIVAKYQQGDFFGESALITRAPRTATVMTREPCRLLKISVSSFWKILSEHPAISNYLELAAETPTKTF